MTHVAATYSLQENGSIKVKNEGYKNGKHKEVEGRAKQPNPADPGKLKVSFFLWFYSDYYVLDIDPDYRYVLIGSSSDKYLWIMSRDKTLSKENRRNCLINSVSGDMIQKSYCLSTKIKASVFRP